MVETPCEASVCDSMRLVVSRSVGRLIMVWTIRIAFADFLPFGVIGFD